MVEVPARLNFFHFHFVARFARLGRSPIESHGFGALDGGKDRFQWKSKEPNRRQRNYQETHKSEYLFILLEAKSVLSQALYTAKHLFGK